MTGTKSFDFVSRLAGAAALIIGLALWGGQLHSLVGLHMGAGVAVVLALWGLAILALRRGEARLLAVGSIVWGAVTLALGLAQTRLLVGDLHWIVQVAHLLVGLGAIAMAAVIARALRQTAPM
jgi:hypothetical protein